tara:strand:+ start:329 stop:514 length:186 start_codon:yes stop_codon:yes gene_type:complete
MNDNISGTYSEEDWRRIKLAVESYVISKESVFGISKQQAEELENFSAIAADIDVFILPPNE